MLIISILKNSRFAKDSIFHKKSKYFYLIHYKSFRDNLTNFLDFDSFLSFILSNDYQFDIFLNMIRYNEMKSLIKAMNFSRDEI